jgi:hypothetical protein
VAIHRGDLVRWVIDWGIFAIDTDGQARGTYPQYCHGIVMEVAEKDPDAVVVYCYDCKNEGGWTILNMIQDKFEILSGEELNEQS